MGGDFGAALGVVVDDGPAADAYRSIPRWSLMMTRISKRTFRSLAAVALVGAATACGSTVDVDHYSGTDVRTVGADSLFTGIDRQYSGLTDSATYAIRTTDAWAALWARASSRQSPAPPLPAVDFTRNMVLVVAMGARNTGGYSVAIDRVTDTDGGGRVVESTLSHPVNCVVTQALTAPFAAVVVPTTSLSVHFVNRTGERRCS